MHAPASRQPATTPPPAWARGFPACASQVGEARRFLAGILDGWPTADDAVLCLSELAANAVTHSNSRTHGGWFTVRAEIHPSNRLRVEVEDQGGRWTRRAREDGQHGHGLLIVGQLARDWGISGDSETGWTVWFEIACPLKQPVDEHARPNPPDAPSIIAPLPAPPAQPATPAQPSRRGRRP